jgi:hypothetical protein
MATDSEWKYCRYSNGLRMLFHLPSDPQEQHNLAEDPRYGDVGRRWDDIIFREITESVLKANLDKKVDGPGAVKIGPFNEKGWNREYPYRI